jgi:tetratricopeptide (TPR) repeat protein
MSRNRNRCIEPQIYASDGATFEEERAILLARFAEKELAPELQRTIQDHLSRCTACAEFLKNLNDIEDFADLKSREMIDASCPSSVNLDRFLFSRNELSADELQRIEMHLQDCPLCEEEGEWLRDIEMQAETPAVHNAGKMPAVHNWFQYASVAAALLFMALSIFLLFDRVSIRNTEARLRSAAVVKEPDQIDYSALKRSSVPLPQKMNVIYEQGIEALKQRRFQEAIRHLELVATAHPDHSGALFLTGYSYYQMNVPERAFELCDRAEKMSPHSIVRCLTLVNIALKTGHYRRALEEISGLHHEAPDHPEVKQTYDRITAISRGRTLRL